jgi:hypothetical protein
MLPPDGGVSDGGGFTIPDGGFTIPDLNISLPDLGAGGTCADLKKCCDALPATSPYKPSCTTALGTNQDIACGAALSGLKAVGVCQ